MIKELEYTLPKSSKTLLTLWNVRHARMLHCVNQNPSKSGFRAL